MAKYFETGDLIGLYFIYSPSICSLSHHSFEDITTLSNATQVKRSVGS